MRRGYSLLRAAVKRSAVLSSALLLSAGALAAPLMTMEGNAHGARYETESGVRISVLSWAEPDQAAQVVGAYNQYLEDMDEAAFLEALAQQPTQGYLFTAAATGYTIKYAWKEESADSDRMVFLVTPGLKTRNPVLWQEPNRDGSPFTLVELHWEGEEAVMKSSLDAPIAAAGGILELENFEAAPVFADMEDSTPYYYAEQS